MDNTLKSTSLQLNEVIRDLIEESERELQSVINRINELNIALQGKDMQTDRSENQDFQVAKDERDMKNAISNLLVTKIKSLQSELDEYTPNGFVTLGTTVELKVISVNGRAPEFSNTSLIFKLVQHATSDATKKLVAIDSTVGAAIIGRAAGETIDVDAPAGLITYKIERIY